VELLAESGSDLDTYNCDDGDSESVISNDNSISKNVLLVANIHPFTNYML
jgi:hypothetical protein